MSQAPSPPPPQLILWAMVVGSGGGHGVSFEHLLTGILLGWGLGAHPYWGSPVMSTWIFGLSCWVFRVGPRLWTWCRVEKEGNRETARESEKWCRLTRLGRNTCIENWPLALLSSGHWPTERLEGVMDGSEWEMTCLGSHSGESSVVCLQVWLGDHWGNKKWREGSVGICGQILHIDTWAEFWRWTRGNRFYRHQRGGIYKAKGANVRGNIHTSSFILKCKMKDSLWTGRNYLQMMWSTRT